MKELYFPTISFHKYVAGSSEGSYFRIDLPTESVTYKSASIQSASHQPLTLWISDGTNETTVKLTTSNPNYRCETNQKIVAFGIYSTSTIQELRISDN